MFDAPNPKAKNIVDSLYKKKPTERFFNNFIKFLVDYNVVGYTSSLLIALSIINFFTKISDYLTLRLNNRIPINKSIKRIIFSFMNVIIVILILYIFTEYIYYKYLYTDDVSNEINVEKVINEKDKETIEKKIEKKIEPKIEKKIKNKV